VDNDKEVALRAKILGRAFRAWRQKRGLTQGEVASALGYSTAQFVSNWERGQSSPPLDTLPKLAEIYSISARDVVKVFDAYNESRLALKREALRRSFTAHKASK